MIQKSVVGEEVVFVNCFWGDTQEGFRRVQERIQHGLNTLQELLDYYQERIRIEKEYSKRLEKLNSRVTLGSLETSSLKVSFDKLTQENKQMVKYTNKFVTSVSDVNYTKLTHFLAQYTKRLSKIEGHMSKIMSKMKESQKTLDTYKSKYQETCSQIKSLNLLIQTTWGKELEKNEAKLAKLDKSLSKAEKNYRLALADYGRIRDSFVRDWPIALQDLYALEVERIQICKINCFTFCNHIATLCVDNDHSADLARTVFAQVQPIQDLQEFGATFGTGNKIYEPPEFIDFMSGHYENENPPKYKLADFENPDVSPFLSKSYSEYSQDIGKSSSQGEQIQEDNAFENAYEKKLPPIKEPLTKKEPPADLQKTTSPSQNISSKNYLSLEKYQDEHSDYSNNADERNDVFSVRDSNTPFTNSNTSSNYSNPTNYTLNSLNSSGERHWNSPRRRESQILQVQEQINKKSKELPISPKKKDTSMNADANKSNIPLTRDFSIDFIAKALEDLNAGGDGDINRYRRSVRLANNGEQYAKTAPTTPLKSDVLLSNANISNRNDHSTRSKHDSILFLSPHKSNYGTDLKGSPKKAPSATSRHSMFDMGQLISEGLLSTEPVRRKEEYESPQTIRHQRTKSLLKSPTKSYLNLRDLVRDPHTDVTEVGRKPFLLKAKALYTYKPRQDGELYFKKGWLMYVIHKQEDDWYICELAANAGDARGMIGLVPGNYVYEDNNLF